MDLAPLLDGLWIDAAAGTGLTELAISTSAGAVGRATPMFAVQMRFYVTDRRWQVPSKR